MLHDQRMRAALVVAITLVCGAAFALGEREKLVFAQIAYAGNWNPRPSALRRLAWEIEKRTSIETGGDPAEVRLSDEAALRRHPLLYLAGDAAFAAPDDADVARLGPHLTSRRL